MKCRFWLVDLNEAVWERKPCVRLWGVDDQNQRVVITATQIPPYFYLLPHEDPNLTVKRLESDQQHFPNIVNVRSEKRKLLGKDRSVLRIVCSQANSVSAYARLVPKILGGTSFDDLRLSTRYITDLNLATCGWNECEIERTTAEDATVDRKYLAKSLPYAITHDSLPKLRLLAFATLLVGQSGSARPERDPIRALAVATNSGDLSLFTLSGDDDSDLLSSFVRAVKDFDPDVIVGYDTNQSQWPHLLQRAKTTGRRLTLGRDQSEPHTSLFGHLSIAGRANVDLADLAAGIVEIKVKDLKNLATYFKTRSADELTVRDDWEKFALWVDQSQREKLFEEIKVSARVSLELAQETIDYPLQLSAITGLPLDQVITAAVGFRVDSYFLRIAHQLGELIPNKNELPFLTYRGALVQKPTTGVHSNVAVLDFASMYPSLMMKYNLSPDTLIPPADGTSENVNLIPELGHRFRQKPDGFYRIALSSLIKERARVKRELASSIDEANSKVLRERERAVKVITNACYGYAGWVGARWYVREVAESAAALGRQLITETIAKARALGLEVLYSDTDSIFVSNLKQKVKELTDWVNKDSEMEIRVEREYERVLFTEAMKRYAGLKEDGTLDIVGLEVVRGDWSDIARSVQETVLLAILKDGSTKLAIQNVRETIRLLRNHEVPITSCVIWKSLTKPIEKYRVRTPHVEVAKKLAKEGWQVTVGGKVGYVIVKGEGALFQKARPYHEVKPEDLDVEYYVENQVKPAAMRILEGLGVTDAQLAA